MPYVRTCGAKVSSSGLGAGPADAAKEASPKSSTRARPSAPTMTLAGEVAVDDAGGVRRGEPAAGLDQHVEDAARRRPRRQPGHERLAVDVLHHHEEAVVVRAALVD